LFNGSFSRQGPSTGVVMAKFFAFSFGIWSRKVPPCSSFALVPVIRYTFLHCCRFGSTFLCPLFLPLPTPFPFCPFVPLVFPWPKLVLLFLSVSPTLYVITFCYAPKTPFPVFSTNPGPVFFFFHLFTFFFPPLLVRGPYCFFGRLSNPFPGCSSFYFFATFADVFVP